MNIKININTNLPEYCEVVSVFEYLGDVQVDATDSPNQIIASWIVT